MTRVLLVGSGGREHALATKLVESGAELYAVIKNRNPGIMDLATDYAVGSETDPETVVGHANRWGIDLAVIGPEAPLGAGVGDSLLHHGFKVASPTQAAARIETDKAWMRDLMKRHDLPGRIGYKVCTDPDEVRAAIDAIQPCVVKPAGLTGGKGVKVQGEHLRDAAEAEAYALDCLDQGDVVIEELLVGEEVTLMAFTDGTNLAPMPLVQDHKRAYEGDEGPNTGGMGSYTDVGHSLPFVTDEDREAARTILQGIVDALREEEHPFVGPIYGQFMLTADGPKVIEINARFGDPEAMNLLTLFDGNLVELCRGLANQSLPLDTVSFQDKATVCVYVVPEGYGVQSRSGEPIQVDLNAIEKTGCHLYYASVDRTPEGLRTTTSRTLAFVALGDTIQEAHERALQALDHVSGPIHVRRDIGGADLVQRRIDHMKEIRG